MKSNLQETADLVTFKEEILNGKLHFLRSVRYGQNIQRNSNVDMKKYISKIKLCDKHPNSNLSFLFFSSKSRSVVNAISQLLC